MTIARPAQLLDFRNARALDPRVAFSRASGATVRDAAGRWREVAANEPRFHHDADGRCLGLLREPGTTNRLRNPRCLGSVPGVIVGGGGASGSGALPTHFGLQTSSGGTPAVGLTWEITAATFLDGGEGFQVRVSGTASANFDVGLHFETSGSNSVNAGEVWTASADAALVAGTVAGLTALSVTATRHPNNSYTVQAGNRAHTSMLDVTGIPMRRAVSLTMGVGTFSSPSVRWAGSAGAVVDITLGIRLPQYEFAPFATTPALPAAGTIANATRAAETISLALADFGLAGLSAYSIVAAARAMAGTPNADQFLAELHDGTADNSIALFRRLSGNAIRLLKTATAVAGTPLDTAAVAAGADYRVALGVAPNDVALSLNGAAPVVSGAATIPAGLTTLAIAGGRASGTPLTGALASLAIYPRRLSNAALQSLGA